MVMPMTPFGAPQPWTVGEVLSTALERFKQSWVVLVFGYLLVFVVTEVVNVPLSIVGRVLVGSRGDPVLQALGGFLALPFTLLVSSFFQVGLMRIWLNVARGQLADFGVLFSGGDRLFPFFFTLVLQVLAVITGSFFFLVPGILLALAWCLAGFYVVDAKMGPIDALTASWNATKGQKGALFVLGLACFGISMLGAAACLVGLFVTTPICYVAFALAFTSISGRGAPAQTGAGHPGYPLQQAGYAPPGPPGGYGAPPGYGGPPPGYGGPPQGPGGGPPPGYGGPGGYGPPR